MSWITVIWSMSAATSLTLAGVHLLVWFRARGAWINLLFTVCAVAAAAHAGFELGMMRATTPEQYGAALRWSHLPASVLVVSLVWFVRLYLRAGRTWLVWTICVLRTLALGLNFSFTPNLNFRQITNLRPFPMLGETVSLPVGVTNPWTLIGQASSLFLLLFVLDASITAWRRGDRRRPLVMGGTLSLAIILAAGQAALLVWGVLPMPYILSLVFLAIILVMGHELSRDVLRAAQLSRELAESEERMSLAGEAAKLGIWIRDLTRNEIWATDGWRALLGFARSERLEMEAFLQRIHIDDRDAVRDALAKATAGDGGYEKEYRVMLPDGRMRWIGSRGQVEFDASGRPVLVRGVSMDITRRKQAELQVQQQRDELAHLSRITILGELSGSLAHELNQPLTAILSNAQAAQRFLARDAPDLEEVRAILGDIVADDRRAGEVIQRLRKMFKKGEVQKQRLDLNDVVHEVLKLMQSELANRGMDVQIALAPELPAIRGDRVQLQQVLLNLIANACNAMKGVDEMDRKLVVRTSASAADGVRVTVSDRGCGIPPENLERIFESFFTTSPQGMGFGLAVCRTIISAHHGKLWAENYADRGASFHFTLPPGNREKEGTHDR